MGLWHAARPADRILRAALAPVRQQDAQVTLVYIAVAVEVTVLIGRAAGGGIQVTGTAGRPRAGSLEEG